VASGVIRGNRIARNLEVNFLSRMLTNTEKLSEFPRGTMSLSGSLRNKHQNILYWLKYWKRRFGDERFNNDRAHLERICQLAADRQRERILAKYIEREEMVRRGERAAGRNRAREEVGPGMTFLKR